MNQPSRDLTGMVIAGRYRVERKLGTGGMGSVWVVQHVESLQRYALKVLHPEAARDRMTVERFLREARAAAALHSKHVVKIVDSHVSYVDETTGQPMPYLVMELLEGSNLEQTIAAHGSLPAAEVVNILRQVARALDLSHTLGIIHRDLKPENLFIHHDEDGDPVVKVCDFGIAKLSGDAAEGIAETGSLGTTSSIAVGTPMYMAPEQIRDSSTVKPSVDQWPVALIAYKALTGRDYFGSSKSTGELLARILGDPIEPPSVRASFLPAGFDSWFLRSCNRAPEQRWASVGEQVRGLAAALGVTSPTPIASDPIPSSVPSREVSVSTAPTLPSASAPVATGSAMSTTNGRAVAPSNPPRPQPTLVVVLAAVVAAMLALLGAALLRRPPSSAIVAPTTAASNASAPSAGVASSSPAPTITVAVATASGAASSVTSTALIAPAPTPVASPRATAKPVAAPSSPPSAAPPSLKLSKGTPCERSSQCASGFCAAEVCQ